MLWQEEQFFWITGDGLRVFLNSQVPLAPLFGLLPGLVEEVAEEEREPRLGKASQPR